MALSPVSSMVPFVTVVAGVPWDCMLFLKKQKKSIKSTKPNARCCTHCYNLAYNNRARCNSDSNVANHVNQL